MNTSIHDVFAADQKRIEDLLERLLVSLATDAPQEPLTLWTELASALLAHLETEEKHLLSELLRARERDARVLLREHRHIRTRVIELGSGLRSRTVHPEDVRNFLDELRAHALNEDRLLYSWADARLDDELRASAAEALRGKRTP